MIFILKLFRAALMTATDTPGFISLDVWSAFKIRFGQRRVPQYIKTSEGPRRLPHPSVFGAEEGDWRVAVAHAPRCACANRLFLPQRHRVLSGRP